MWALNLITLEWTLVDVPDSTFRTYFSVAPFMGNLLAFGGSWVDKSSIQYFLNDVIELSSSK